MKEPSVHYTRGFTLVEVTVCVVIIAILATITVVGYNGLQDRAYSARMMASVDSYVKGLRVYHTMYRKFPDFNGKAWACLGRVQDYPAKDGFPAGVCEISSDGSTVSADDALYNQLKSVMGDMPDPTTKVARENYTFSNGTTAWTQWRGIYYEYTDNKPGGQYADWAYVEYVINGNEECPKSYVTRYNADTHNTFCSQVIWADDAGSS